MYLGNLTESVSESQITEYLKGNGVEVKKCFIMKSNISGTKSARLSIPIEEKEKVLNASFWPKFVRVRSWVFKPKQTPTHRKECPDKEPEDA